MSAEPVKPVASAEPVEAKPACPACERVFSTAGNLARHLANQRACAAWIAIGDRPPPLVAVAAEVIGVDAWDRCVAMPVADFPCDPCKPVLPTTATSVACRHCHRAFNCAGALNKHLRRSVVCGKWAKHDVLLDAARLVSEAHAVRAGRTMQKLADKQCRPVAETGHEPLRTRYSVHLQADVTLVTIDTPRVELIDRVLAPQLEDIACVVDVSSPAGVVGDHVECHRMPDTTCTSAHSVAILAAYADAYDFVNARFAAGKSVAVLCHTGFQRSLPFLVYCIMRNSPGSTTHDAVMVLQWAGGLPAELVGRRPYGFNYAPDVVGDSLTASIGALFADAGVRQSAVTAAARR
jgi:hypothetical protein